MSDERRHASVRLMRADENDKATLANLLQLCRHDFSAFRPYSITDHGLYTYRYLDLTFLEDQRDAHLIRVDQELGGFTMTRELDDGVREVSEFFVLRRWRGAGVAGTAARQMFDLHPGRWLVSFDAANEAAGRFWPKTVTEVAAGDVVAQRKPADSWYPGTDLLFSTV